MDFESLIIRFSEDWELSFIFGRSTDTSTNSSYFYINQVNFTYTLDAEHFPNLSGKFIEEEFDTLPRETNCPSMRIMGEDYCTGKQTQCN